MKDVLMVFAIVLILGLLVASVIERRRMRHYEESWKKHMSLKEEVERQSRKQL